MKISTLIRSVHRKSAYAEYKRRGLKLFVFLYNNVPCTNEWGDGEVVCHVEQTGEKDRRFVFSSYKDFSSFRKELQLGTDK